MAINDDLFDSSVRSQVFLQRYGGGVTNRIIGLLNAADADVVRILNDRLALITRRGFDTGPATTARLQKLSDAIRLQRRDVYGAIGKTLTSELRELAGVESDIVARRLEEAIGVDIGILRPPPEVLRAAVTAQPLRGKLLKTWVRDMSTADRGRIMDHVRLGIVEGETTDQIIRRIRGTRALRFTDGALEISRRSAETLVRTSVNHIGNRARELTYEANADIVDKVQWKSTLDGRTSPICRARDGNLYDLGTGPRPPAHPRCRSILTPVTKSWDELAGPNALKPGRGSTNIDTLFDQRLQERGFSASQAATIKRNTRASMNGQVPADTTYGQWLKRQTTAFQNDVMGPTKAKLFRAGVPMDRFVDRVGNTLTIDELRIKEAAAFTKAGIE